MRSPYFRSIPTPEDFTPFPRSATKGSIPQRFGEIVARSPEKSAIRDHAKELSYSELRALVHIAAANIQRFIGNSDTPVGVGLIFEPSVESVVGIMGTLTSGNFFCPISPYDHPQNIRKYLDDAEIDLILTTRGTISGNLESELQSFQLVFIEDVTEDLAESTSVSVQIDPHQLAAILYTSGSTGTPKGVIHTHHSLLHLVMNKGNLLGISASDRIAGLSTFTFASYYWNVFAALLFGATLYLYDACTSSG